MPGRVHASYAITLCTSGASGQYRACDCDTPACESGDSTCDAPDTQAPPR